MQTTSSALPADAAETAKTPAHQQVYEALRVKILFGDLAPGEAVTIQGLTESMGAGMTPVREALRRLTAEGALVHQGNRRVSVPVLTAQDMEELHFMRRTLEPELTRRAAERITAAELDQLATCDAALNGAIARGDVGGYLTHNYHFHAAIYSVAQAPVITTTVDRLWLSFGPSLRVICGRIGTSSLPDKHADLLNALKAGDTEAAARAMQEDVDQGMAQIRSAV